MTEQSNTKTQEVRSTILLILFMLLTSVIVLLALWFALTCCDDYKTPKISVEQEQPSPVVTPAAPVVAEVPEELPEEVVVAEEPEPAPVVSKVTEPVESSVKAEPKTVEQQPLDFLNPAQKATVGLRFGTMVGSGVFLHQSCNIVTNYHLVAATTSESLQQFENNHRQLRETKTNLALSPNDGSEEAKQRRQQLEKKVASLQQLVDEHIASLATETIEVTVVSGEVYEAEVLVFDAESNLAILKSPKSDCVGLQPDLAAAPATGDALYLFSKYKNESIVFAEGFYSGRQAYKDIQQMQCDVKARKAQTGGPVVDAKGQLVGISNEHFLSTMGLSYATPVDHLSKLLLTIKE